MSVDATPIEIITYVEHIIRWRGFSPQRHLLSNTLLSDVINTFNKVSVVANSKFSLSAVGRHHSSALGLDTPPIAQHEDVVHPWRVEAHVLQRDAIQVRSM
eukprot:CAMPEP_0115626210 /NCGR_PEP_ID=MMETSP0272-20121206/28223_1 /TAXON_ID=71861 /ORGANISM="Scrippsiella trochoidea, Strain CCMP3099" /LENGTH=100 /DNA_ID=CAMNT_0003062551 /DNA_START=1950 /DNA_END=2252 /DNA_ORIENTATION=-